MQYIDNLTEKNLENIKSGEYFIYKIYMFHLSETYYRKGLKINNRIIPIGGHFKTIEQAKKAY